MSGRAARLAAKREIGGARMPAVHRLKDAVGARLHRQMEVGHQLFFKAMRLDQALAHASFGWLVV